MHKIKNKYLTMEIQIMNKLDKNQYLNNNDILLDLIDVIKLIISNINNNKKANIILKQLKNIIDIMNKVINDNILNTKRIDRIHYGDSRYIGEIKYGKREGKGKYYYNNGDRYEGDFKNGLFDGKGVFYCKNGDKYEGDLKNGICDGKGILYFKSGSKYDGEFKNDKKEGKGIYYYNNGDRYEGEWKNDTREGKGI